MMMRPFATRKVLHCLILYLQALEIDDPEKFVPRLPDLTLL